VILFAISGTVSIIVSLLTPPIAEEHLYRLTFWSRHSTKVRVDLDNDAGFDSNEDIKKEKGIFSRPRTYPFFEDIYPILYHGPKSDIISYPISRQKIEKGYISYILSNFDLASKT
jgi:hypothetical protein